MGAQVLEVAQGQNLCPLTADLGHDCSVNVLLLVTERQASSRTWCRFSSLLTRRTHRELQVQKLSRASGMVGGYLPEGEAVRAAADFSVVKCFVEEKGFF